MALWNRSSYLFIARLIPIVLILSAGFFWKYEKHVRLQTEKRLKTVSEQLVKSQGELTEARQEAQTANEERRFLIQQLGQRDEHIRRLLAEMIRLLSGSGSVDLGEVLVRSQNSDAWDGVQKEMKNIMAQRPINGGAAAAAPAAPRALAQASAAPAVLSPRPAAAPGIGLRQTQVESRPVSTPAAASVAVPGQGAVLAGPSPARMFESLAERKGEILTVNEEHRFVVISQGSQNGLKQDALFDMYAGDTKLGRVRVGTVYDRISTVSIVDGDIRQFRESSSIRLEPAR